MVRGGAEVDPRPLEVERDPVGIYVLDDTRAEPVYVYVRGRL